MIKKATAKKMMTDTPMAVLFIGLKMKINASFTLIDYAEGLSAPLRAIMLKSRHFADIGSYFSTKNKKNKMNYMGERYIVSS